MKLPFPMIEMYLRSAGAPPALLELLRKLNAEGMAGLKTVPVRPDDPTWALIQADPLKQHNGVWARLDSGQSRITVGVFIEGDSDLAVSLGALAGVQAASLPAPKQT